MLPADSQKQDTQSRPHTSPFLFTEVQTPKPTPAHHQTPPFQVLVLPRARADSPALSHWYFDLSSAGILFCCRKNRAYLTGASSTSSDDSAHFTFISATYVDGRLQGHYGRIYLIEEALLLYDAAGVGLGAREVSYCDDDFIHLCTRYRPKLKACTYPFENMTNRGSLQSRVGAPRAYLE